MRYFNAFVRGIFSMILGKDTTLSRRCNLYLFMLAAVVSLLLWTWPSGTLTVEGERVWDRIREAQFYLYSLKTQSEGVAPSQSLDPWQSGLIGTEWSNITTTVGSLASKQISCNPLWGTIFLRWFDKAGLKRGDRIAILSSGSFPGFLISSLVAAEERGLDVLLIVSLGASSYGANDPNFPISVILMELRRAGFISTKAAFYTFGGDYEIGAGIPPDGLEILSRSAISDDVPLLQAKSLQEVIDSKMGRLDIFKPALVVQIGGSHANMGTDDAVLSLPPGFLDSRYAERAGNGVIGLVLKRGIPVIHILNVKSLCRMTGVSEGVEIAKKGPKPFKFSRAFLGLLFFAVFLYKYERWAFE